MSQPNTNSKNASFDDNFVPSMLIKDASTNETVAVTNGSGSPSTTPTGASSVPLAKYNAIPTTRTEGQFGVLQADTAGNLNNNLGTTIAGEDITNDRLKTEYRGASAYISTATTTTVKTGAGHLHSIVVNGGTAGTIIGYDNTAASGTILFSFDSTNALNTYMFDVSFSIGLTIITSAATKLSVSYR